MAVGETGNFVVWYPRAWSWRRLARPRRRGALTERLTSSRAARQQRRHLEEQGAQEAFATDGEEEREEGLLRCRGQW